MKEIIDIPRTAMEVYNMLPEGTRCEVIDNTLFMSPSPTSDHQDILGEIFFNIKLHIAKNNAGKVFIALLDVYLDHEESVVQPDIVFINTENLNRVVKKGIVGSPDLIIEVLSPNKSYDKEKKFELYQRNQITEYIIIDPDNREVLQYLLTEGRYQQKPTTKGELFIEVLQLNVDL